MKRIFIAINLPEEIKAQLGNIERETADMFPEEVRKGIGKWVKNDNLHITLLFIGEVKNENIDEICGKVEGAVAVYEPFKVFIKKVCYDTVSKGAPRLIWAEIEKNENLQNIANALGNHGFKSHITLARIKQWAWKQIEPDERPNIEQEIDLNFEVKSVEIMESQLKRTGAEYKIVSSVSF